MAIAKNRNQTISNKLIHNFLYNSDIDSIHILLNLYDIEYNIANIYPRYISIKYIKRHLNRTLKGKRGKYLISLNLGQLIHDDIDRLELFIYLEGYRNGYLCNHWTNILEKKALEKTSLEELYNNKYLYHNDKTKEIQNIKTNIFIDNKHKEKTNKNLSNSISKYCDNIVKKKVLSLNKYLDKQLTIEYSGKSYFIKEDYSLLTLEELMDIYKEILKVVNKIGSKLYNDAFWYGLNDRVLKRYR